MTPPDLLAQLNLGLEKHAQAYACDPPGCCVCVQLVEDEYEAADWPCETFRALSAAKVLAEHIITCCGNTVAIDDAAVELRKGQ